VVRVEPVGDYRIEGLLGSGAFGAVYAAHHREDPGKRVAVKVLHPGLASQPPVVQRFFREALALARLDHPRIPKILSFGPWQETYYLVQEFTDGTPLSIPDGGLSLDRAEQLVEQLLEALVYAHERGVIHRDLKLENLLLSPDGGLKILDFGLADVAGAAGGGGGAGTPGWSAPEQLRGRGEGPPADLFSVGVLLHALLTGRLPGPADDLDAYLAWAEGRDRGSLRALRPGLPERVIGLFLRLTAPLPEERPGAAAQALAELRLRAHDPGLLSAAAPTAQATLRLRMDREAYDQADDPLCHAHFALELVPGATPAPAMQADLALVLDVSGSMNSPDRYPLLRKALGEFLRGMAPRDRVAIFVFSDRSGVIAPLTSGEKAARNAERLVERMDGSPCKFGGATFLRPGLTLAREEFARSSRPPTVRRVYVLTDGEIHDSDPCAEELGHHAEAGIEVHVYGFGSHFDGAALKELVKDQRGGSVKPICNEQDVVETFAHIAAVNRRLLGQEACVSFCFSEEIDVGDLWMFRPQERYLGPVRGRRAERVLGGIEAGRIYEFLAELRLPPAEAQPSTPLGEITLSFQQGASLRVELAFPAAALRQPGGHGAEVPAVARVLAILDPLRSTDAPDAALRAARARLDLAVAEQRDPGLIEALRKQIDVLEGRASNASLDDADQQYLASDLSSVILPLR
jgi:serine/threonine protein kinase